MHEYLGKRRALLQEIDRLYREYDAKREQLYSIGGFAFDREKVSSTPSNDKWAKLLGEMDVLSREIDVLSEEAEQMAYEYAQAFSWLTEDERAVMSLRYIYMKEWEDIVELVKKPRRTVFYLRKKAVEKLGEVLP